MKYSCRRFRCERGAFFLSAFLALALPEFSRGDAFPSFSNTNDMVSTVNSDYCDTVTAKIIMPGDVVFKHSLGLFTYPAGMDTNFLALLVSATNGGIPTFTIEVKESTNATSRTRSYLNSTGGVAMIVQTPTNWDWQAWSRAVYGTPPVYLSGTNLDAWYRDRDPSRLHICLEMISTSSVPAYLAMITNNIGSGSGTNIDLIALYSNDLVVVKTEQAGSTQFRFHAPANIPLIDVFSSPNLLGTQWSLATKLAHSADPVLWAYAGTDSNAFVTIGNPIDTDLDGVPDDIEILVLHTDPYCWDTDGDGVPDGLETLNFSSNPNSSDSGGDGLGDGWKAYAGLNPSFAYSTNTVASNGLTYATCSALGIGLTTPRDPETEGITSEVRRVASKRSLPGESIQGFQQQGYYRTVALTAHADWNATICWPLPVKDYVGTVDASVSASYVRIGLTNDDCQQYWRANGGTLHAHKKDTIEGATSNLNTFTDADGTWTWNSFGAWSPPAFPYQLTAAGAVTSSYSTSSSSSGSNSTSQACSNNTPPTIDLESSSIVDDGTNSDTRLKYTWNGTYSVSCGGSNITYSPVNGSAIINLSDDVTTNTIKAEIDADVHDTNIWTTLGWGGDPDWLHTCGSASICGNGIAAYDQTTTDSGMMRGQYRIYVDNSELGAPYECAAILRHQANGEIISGTMYSATGTGSRIYLTPTNNVTVEPPSSPDCIELVVPTVTFTYERQTIPARTTWYGAPAALTNAWKTDITVHTVPSGLERFVSLDFGTITPEQPATDTGEILQDSENSALWHYTAFSEEKFHKHPKLKKVVIVARMYGAASGVGYVKINSIFDHLVNPTTGYTADKESAWQYAQWKYDVDTSALASISYSAGQTDKAGNTTLLNNCTLGPPAFYSENDCASTLIHENKHGQQSIGNRIQSSDQFFYNLGKDFCEIEAYDTELSNVSKTEINAAEVQSVKDWKAYYNCTGPKPQ